jgi:iron complex transport system substrate-binding protein
VSNRFFLWRRRLAAFGLMWFAHAALAAGVQVTDERGVTTQWATPPQRIVSLLPSLTETVCELGACARLVGVDRYSNWPASVKQLPQLGGGIDPNVEAVVALRPDVVLIAGSSRAIDPLRALGLKVVVLEPKDAADVRRVLSSIGQLLGADPLAPQRIWNSIDAAVSAAAQSLPANVKQIRVYFEVNSAPYGAGESSFIGEMLSRLGARNILPASMGPFPKFNPEFVVRANPDLIMVGDQNFGGQIQRPGWAGIRALRENRVCVFSAAQSDVLVRPGPRMAEAARIMARCLKDKTQ